MLGKPFEDGKSAVMIAGGFLAGLLVLATHVNRFVPEAYMDEVFHIKQTQQYCAGDFATWDPKITTPPGLYYASCATAYLFGCLNGSASTDYCTVPVLRATNIVFALVNFFLVYSILVSKHLYLSKRDAVLQALTMATFPPVFLFYFLHYTDAGSISFVMLSYLMQEKGYTIASSLVGIASLLFRQTNIIWIGFICFEGIDKIVVEDDAELEWKKWIRMFLSKRGKIMAFALPYIFVLALFLSFVYVNEGIVLGDRSMHFAVFHAPQVLYFLLFYCCLNPGYVIEYLVASPRIITSRHRLIVVVCLALVMFVIINRFTMVHPYILADNRHFTFYFWRRILNLNEWSRYCLIPIYALCLLVVLERLSSNNPISVIALGGAISACLIPVWLLEMRYFIIPAYFISLLGKVSPFSVRVNLLSNLIANSILLYFFLFKTFVAPDGEVARFMW